jgi:hypothetical protein
MCVCVCVCFEGESERGVQTLQGSALQFQLRQLEFSFPWFCQSKHTSYDSHMAIDRDARMLQGCVYNTVYMRVVWFRVLS